MAARNDEDVEEISKPVSSATNNDVEAGENEEKVSEQAAPNVLDPKLYGYDSKHLPFRIFGDAIYEEIGELRRLLNVDAEFKTVNGESIFVKSSEGLYNQEEKSLKLNGNVILENSSGSTLKAPSMELFYDEKIASGSGGVLLEDEKGQVSAENFKVEDNYNKITFSGGRVKSVIKQDE